MDNERIQWAARMLTLLEPLKSRLTPGGTARLAGGTAVYQRPQRLPTCCPASVPTAL